MKSLQKRGEERVWKFRSWFLHKDELWLCVATPTGSPSIPEIVCSLGNTSSLPMLEARCGPWVDWGTIGDMLADIHHNKREHQQNYRKSSGLHWPILRKLMGWKRKENCLQVQLGCQKDEQQQAPLLPAYWPFLIPYLFSPSPSPVH